MSIPKPGQSIERYIDMIETFITETPEPLLHVHIYYIPASRIAEGVRSIKSCPPGYLLWYWRSGFKRHALYTSKSNEIISLEFEDDKIFH
jgi:hypothetical protein